METKNQNSHSQKQLSCLRNKIVEKNHSPKKMGKTKMEKTFKEKYSEIDTIKDGHDLVESTSTKELIKFRDAFEILDEMVSLNMRISFLYDIVKVELDNRAKKDNTQ